MAFANVKVLDTKAKSPRKGSDKEIVEIKGLERRNVLDSLIKNLTTIYKTVDAEVKDIALGVFLDRAHGRRPANFRGVEGRSEASVELRKRSTLSPLSDEEAEAFEANGIPYDTLEDVVDTFVINPAYAADNKLLAKVEKALSGVKDCPADFILKQEGKARRVVTDESIEAVFAKGLDELVGAVSVLAVKGQTKVPLAESLEIVKQVLTPQNTLVKDLKASLGKQ